MKSGMIIGLVVLIAIVVLGFSFLKAPSQEKITETIPAGAEEETEIEEPSPVEPSEPVIKEFTITESNFELVPNTITVNHGDIVRINVIVEQGSHNLFIENYNQKTSVSSSSTPQTIEFVADENGIFVFWCQVSGHRSNGMEGTLIVE